MTNMDIRDLVKAIALVIGISLTLGQFDRLRDYALKEGIRAITYADYKPVYFFGR